MKKKSLLFIGGIGVGEIPTNGETAKNQVLLKRFEELFEKVYIIDSYHWRRNPFVIVKMLLYIIFLRHTKVVVSCHKSGMPVLNFIEKTKFQKEVYYWAIGSGLMEWINEGAVTMKACRFMKKIVAESPTMVKELERMGLDNVEYMPNMKPVIKVRVVKKDRLVNFVFLSRIIEEKGCLLIIDCCKELNKLGYQDKYTVTFYGDVTEEPDILKRIEEVSNIQYKGILDLTSQEGYDKLASYSVFLFPTYYPNEGFPGVLMDALMSGLPIIATDWKYNLDIVENGYNGIVIQPKNLVALLNVMKKVINNEYDIEKMSLNCKESAKKYDVYNVLTKERLQEFDLL